MKDASAMLKKYKKLYAPGNFRMEGTGQRI